MIPKEMWDFCFHLIKEFEQNFYIHDSTAVLKNRSNILIINGEQKGLSENY